MNTQTEEAAEKYAYEEYSEPIEKVIRKQIISSFKAGALWQQSQLPIDVNPFKDPDARKKFEEVQQLPIVSGGLKPVDEVGGKGLDIQCALVGDINAKDYIITDGKAPIEDEHCNAFTDFTDYSNDEEQEGKAVGDAEIEKIAKETFPVDFSDLQPNSRMNNIMSTNVEQYAKQIGFIAGYKAALQPEAEGTTYSEWQLCPKCGGNGIIPNNFLAATTTPFIQCDVCFGAKVLVKNVSENIAAYVHEIDNLRETNRKLGDKIAELQKEIDEKNKEICDLLDWGNAKDSELDRLEKKITEIQNDFMQVQTNQQLAKFEKEERKKA